MFSSSAFGNRSNTRRFICMPTTASASRGLPSADIWISIIACGPIRALTACHPTRLTSIRRRWRRRPEIFRRRWSVATPVGLHPSYVATDHRRFLTTNPGGTPLIIRGKLFRQPRPALLTQRTGSIINIASIAAHRGGISRPIYTISKGAVLAFKRSAAAELGEKGIRVNSISPGAIVTGIFGKLAGVEVSKAARMADLVKGGFAALQPIPRVGATDDIARAAVYLAGDGSSFVNG